MSSLLTQINSGKQKTAYQAYTVKHGIESFKILVPLANTPVFEQQFKSLENTAKSVILKLVDQVGGKIRG